ncbi:class I SAM-dependent methyltransferase [Parvularcula sp. LCG005]|uniref:class I SAM-dependent methyltransferase n=1 Tax=Parvularcula sp. LCG005 TaxID=3078805 RepID=UPI00294296C1|nr:methyltransferase domain-containing protein [Parvularcula sp. LCG005]WOI53887.1 methyltransferase domain-containing protein [Parvularcula sp. LCG005]
MTAYTKMLFAAGVIMALGACSPGDQADSTLTATETPAAEQAEAATLTETPAVAVEADPMAAALAHPDRPAEERTRDASRLPAETLDFAGLEPGMTVLEMEAGGGYFTEIIARVIGADGTLYMQNPPAFDGFLGDSLTVRLGDDRLPNVSVLRTNFDDLQVEDGSIDLITWIQGPHELWFAPNGQNLGDPAGAFAEITRVLKPGGRLLLVDHRAADGAGTEAGATLHRIEASIVEDMAITAGLTKTAESDILSREDDPLTANVFDEAIRGKTDQFVLLFTK